MWKSILGSHNNTSELSNGRRDRRRDGDEDSPRTRTRADSTGTSSSTKRKSSKRDDPERNGGVDPTSANFSSSSRSPYAGTAAPNVASSYATAHTDEPTNAPIRPAELTRNEGMAEEVQKLERRQSRKDSKRESRSDVNRARGLDDNDDEARNAGGEKRKRDQQRSSKRKDSSRAVDDADASRIDNQFPGQDPAGTTIAAPYRPPLGLAADYYGDHGESVAFQPGVRPNAPDIVTSAEQAHLLEPTIEAKPPPEPSSLGVVGAAASFFDGGDFATDDDRPTTTPSKKSGKRPNLKPGKNSSTNGASPRSSPGPDGRRPLPSSRMSGGIGPVGAVAMAAGIGVAGVGAAEYALQTPNGRIPPNPSNSSGGRPPPQSNFSGQIGTMGSGAINTGVGAAAEYYTGDIPITSGNSLPSTAIGSQSYQTAQSVQSTTETASFRPPRRPSNTMPYGAAAAATGLAAAAGAAYLAHEHNQSEHQQHTSNQPQNQSGNPPFVLGQIQPALLDMQGQQQRYRHRHRGPFGRVIEWFQDPAGVAEYEAYSEAIGICKYCFDPNSSPKDAPRRHHYKSRRRSGERYGSSTRVDKLGRHSSDEERRRRKEKSGYSTTEKVLAGGLAAAGAVKIGEAIYKQKNDFDDTYSVKSGRPSNRSRVSFQEQEDERYSTSRRKRRESAEVMGLSIRDSNERRQSESEFAHEKRSSKRRDSSASEGRSGFSKGAALSAGVAAAGIAGAMPTGSSSRRRSRSPKNKKGYYSKRISPKHSYVDLTNTAESEGGPFGLGGFFSSPSANERRKKKQKGLFNFANASSSSSDADLAFGHGTVKRKNTRSSKGKEDQNDHGNTTAAILGLAATGAALAAESERKEDRKGKRRGKNDRIVGQNGGHDDRRPNRIVMSDSVEGNEDVWEDASEDGASSIDTALAYGGRLSARQSRESLNDGTDKWGWRWGSKKENDEKRARRKSSKPDLSTDDPLAAGLVGAGVGAAAAAAYSYQSTPGVASTPGSLPPMQYVDPVPADSNFPTPSGQMYGVVGVSPRSSFQPPLLVSTSDSVEIQAPQPVTPISQHVYSSIPSGPTVFDKYSASQSRVSELPKQMPAYVDISERKRDMRRSETLPAAFPLGRHGVEIGPAEEQVARNVGEESKKGTLRKGSNEKRERQIAGPETKAQSSIITGAERSPERKLETWRLRDAVQAYSPPAEPPTTMAKEVQSTPQSQPKPADRLSEIDRQLQELYEEKRRSEARKKKEIEAVGVTAAAVAIGAGVVASNREAESDDEKRKKSRRKSSLKKTRSRDTDSPPASASDSQQERIARMAAQRVKNTPSPVYDHDDYSTFFVPPELAKNVKEHNYKADHRDDVDAQIVDVAPKDAEEIFPFDLYHPFGTEDSDNPLNFPWPVPLLELVSPTPPHGRSPMIRPSRSEKQVDVSEDEIPRPRSSSRVTWGDHEINVYEVITPEYERDGHDFTGSSSPGSGLKQVETIADDEDKQPVPPVEKMTEEQREHVSMGKDFADLPSSKKEEDKDITPIVKERESFPKGNSYEHDIEFAAALAAGAAATGFDPKIVTEDPKYYRRDSPPGVNDDANSQRLVYQSPFSETVSDLGVHGDVDVIAGKPGFVEGERPETTYAQKTITAGDEESAKDEKRRKEPVLVAAQSAREISARSETTVAEGAEPKLSRDFNVFDYMEDSSGQPLPSASVLGSIPASVVDTYPSQRDTAEENLAKPKRAATFDEEKYVESFATPKSKPGYTSDPEDWEKSSSSKKSKKSKTAEDDFYERKRSSKSRSKRDSQSLDDDDTRSVASSHVDDSKGDKKLKRKSKRDSEIFDDDTKSVASTSADGQANGDSKRKSKERSAAKKSGWAAIAGLISSSKSDISSTSEKRKSKSSDSDKRRRKSKDRDFDDSASEPRRSRSASQSSTKLPDRDQSIEDGFFSAEENGHNGDVRDVDEAPFLAERPEMPAGYDGASGLKTESHYRTAEAPSEESTDGTLSRSKDIEATANTSLTSAPQADLSSPLTEPRQRRLSMLRTTDLASSPMTTSSPTAVPIRFGRLPMSPGNVRTGSISSPAITSASPSSPLTTPRTRQGRPTSANFGSSKEFRPLYLVERHSFARQSQSNPQEEEQYPSLPSSRTSSAHPSMENLRGEQTDEDVEQSPQQLRERQRRYSYSYWGDNRPKSPEFLDSGTATPTALDFSDYMKRDSGQQRGKPKYEFHSPSELLEDPRQHQDMPREQEVVASPLPGTTETEKPTNRPASPAMDESKALGLALAGSGATVLAANAIFGEKGQDSGRRESSAGEGESMARGVEAPEQSTKSRDDGFVLQPVSSKKTKKDKKKKRKTLDLENDNVELSDPSDVKGLPEVEDAAAAGEQERDPVAEAPVAEIEAATGLSSTEIQQTNQQDAERAFPTEKSKKDKKDKKKDKQGKRKDSLPLLSTTLADEEAVFNAGGVAEPADAMSAVEESCDLTPAPEDELVMSTRTRDSVATMQDNALVDETDRAAGLDEKTSRESYPFPEAVPLPEDDDLSLRRTESFVPAHQDIPNLGALKAAFDHAVRARGLPNGMTREIAMEGFLPRRDNAPHQEFAGKPLGFLTPIGETSKTPSPVVLEAKDLAFERENPFGDDYEIGASRDARITATEPVAPEYKNAHGDDMAIAPNEKPQPYVTVPPPEGVVEIMPAISEIASRAEERTPDDIAGDRENLADLETTAKELLVVAEEEAWLPPATSKKDKKKKRKSKGVDEFLESTEVPMVNASSTEPTVEQKTAPLETPSEQVEDSVWGTTKKSKKDKKTKKKDKVTDIVEDDTSGTASGTGSQTPADLAGDGTHILDLPTVATNAASESTRDIEEQTTIVDETLDPEQRTLIGEDLAWAPPKKSKKDKKSKKKGRGIDDSDFETPDIDTRTSADNAPEPPVPLTSTEPISEADDEPKPLETTELLSAAGEHMEAGKAGDELPEDFAWAPTKKSKKSKKPKSKGLDLDDIESPDAPSPAPEQRDAEEGSFTDPVVASIAGLAAGGLAGLAVASAIQETPQEKQEEDDNLVAPALSKKGKKDKKSKKGKSFSWDDEEASAPATATPGLEMVADTEDRAATVEEPVIIDDVEGPAHFGEKLTNEPESQQMGSKEIEDDTWATPSSRKKDKKGKKKKQSLAAPLEDEQTQAEEPSEKGGQLDPGISHVDEVARHYYGVLRDHQPKVSAPDNKPVQVVHEEPASSARQACAPASNEDDAPPSPNVDQIDNVVAHYHGLLRDYQPSLIALYKMSRHASVAQDQESGEVLQPEPVHDPGEDTSAIPTKKSNKDKKEKRESTTDHLAVAVVPALVLDELDEPAKYDLTNDQTQENAALEEQREISEDAPTAVAEEDTFIISSQKSKKGKKKKRRSTIDDFASTELAPVTTEEPKKIIADELIIQEPEDMPIDSAKAIVDPPVVRREEPSSINTKKGKKEKKNKRQPTFDDLEGAEITVAGEIIQPATEKSQEVIADEVPAEPATFDDSHWSTGKTSKKDKKKKKTQLSWADDEDSTSQPTETSTPVREMEPDEARQLQDESRQRSNQNEETVVNPEAEQTVLPKNPVVIEDLNNDDLDNAMRHEGQQPRSESGAFADEYDRVDQAPETARHVEGLEADETDKATAKEAPVEEQWDFTDKKAKKDQKGKKSKTAVEEFATRITPEVEDQSIQESGEQPTKQADEIDEWGVKRKISKRDKKGRKGVETFVPEPESVQETEGLPIVEPIQEAAKEAAEEEERGFTTKKSKKDKKGKKGVETFVPEPEAIQETEGLPTVDPIQEAAKEAAEEEEWGFTIKKSKQDKKGRKGVETFIPEPKAVQETEGMPTVEPIPETAKEAAEEEAWGFSTKKSKKDKKGKKGIVTPVIEPESILKVEDLQILDPAQELLKEAKDEEEWGLTTKKSKKDKKGKKGNRNSIRDSDGAERESAAATLSRDFPTEPSAGHIDDVVGHYFGILRNYQPAASAPDNKPAVSARDVKPSALAEEIRPVISDEESKRARRKTRAGRASPVYKGEEPEDLPGNRSVTPTAERDATMDTALGVAAGLGLAGVAASAGGARGAGDSQAVDEPRAAATLTEAPSWSFAKLGASGNAPSQVQRDSGIQFADSPTLPHGQFESRNRDSGYVHSPGARSSWQEESARGRDIAEGTSRPPRPQSPTSSLEDVGSGKQHIGTVTRDLEDTPARREPSPVKSTSKDRSSKLFDSSPSNRTDVYGATPQIETANLSQPATDIHRSPSIHGHHRSREELRTLAQSQSQESEPRHPQPASLEPHRSIFGPYPTQEGLERGFSPPKTPLHTIHERSPQELSPSLRRQRDNSDVGSPNRHGTVRHGPSGNNLREAAGLAGAAGISALPATALSGARDDPASGTKSLGKSKSRTTSSRSLRRSAAFDPNDVPSSSTHDPFKDRGKEVARDMADVYDGYGEFPGSPMSPTRPPSVRKRQSMQQIKDLEARLDQLASENRLLAEAKIAAERHLEDLNQESTKSDYATQEALQVANVQLREKDDDISKLREGLEWMKQEVSRLTEVNQGLGYAHENLRAEHDQRYSQLEEQHAETHQQWQESSRELDTLRSQHAELSTGMEDIVRHEIDTALADKNAEIERLRGDLEVAKEKIQELQQQILSSNADEVLEVRDEDYFEAACQSLCQHVQQWVLKFSKFSDLLVCRTTSQIRDEKVVDRFDNAILDGSDVDVYLSDRVKRRDVFMSVVMTMIWEYIFTRYLFGMDREQRQKLKQLEKNLAEVGPPSAVHHWRAMTLTLLAKREAFKDQRESDTEAVVNEIYDNLSRFLPPPQNLQKQIQDSLRNVLRTAVSLSIEMRTQRAEYIMLPPLQPEYDTNGDLARKVYFNASLMNERSGETTSNDDLEAQQAVVRMVLFPLVVKKGTDDGEGEEEIVVCPAQVLVARPGREKKARVASAQSDRMSVDQRSQRNASVHSFAPSGMDMTNVI